MQLTSQAAGNREAIREVLATCLPAQGLVLEVASGRGEHIAHLARRFENLAWQPSERDPEALASIAIWRDEAALPNLLRAVELDVTATPWPVAKADAIVCIDFAHVVPMETVHALYEHAARTLVSGGLFFITGPFRFHGKYTSKAHEDLDASLRQQDPALALRDVREVTAAGTRTGLGLEHVLATGTQHSLIYSRRAMLPATGGFQL